MQQEKDISMLILNLLKSGDLYGYEMMEKIELLSNEYFKLKAGTLYPILHGMEDGGLIESYEKKADNGRMRKYYRITNQGGKVLKEKKSEWKSYVEMITSILGEQAYEN
ncbi:helix-turn-helix transcriptional regulator [Proteiniborus sp.]|uniref:PadR family transcriptional regulator n=1 Tax=Proteiniborus sp. TaxID=2079015 RepID=UPI003329FF58